MRLSLPQWVVCAALAATTLIARADTFIFLISTGSTSTTPGTTFIVNGTLTGTPDSTIPGAIDLTGITYNPLTRAFRLSPNTDVNYLAHFRRPG